MCVCERERDLTPTLEVAWDPPSTPLEETNGSIDVDERGQLGCDYGAHTLNMSDPCTLATCRGWWLPIHNGLASIHCKLPLLLALALTQCPCLHHHNHHQDHDHDESLWTSHLSPQSNIDVWLWMCSSVKVFFLSHYFLAVLVNSIKYSDKWIIRPWSILDEHI